MFKLLKWLCRSKVVRISPSDTVVVSSDAEWVSQQALAYVQDRWEEAFDGGPRLVILDCMHIEGVVTGCKRGADDN